MEHEPKKTQQTFDIQEYAEKAKAALTRLEQERRPGEKVGIGGKMDVLQAVKTEIEQLISKGYTPHQVSEALRDDVFRILPKSITQLIANKPKKPRKKRKMSTNNVQPQDTTRPSAAPPAVPEAAVKGHQQKENLSTINVKPDRLFAKQT